MHRNLIGQERPRNKQKNDKLPRQPLKGGRSRKPSRHPNEGRVAVRERKRNSKPRAPRRPR